MKRATAAISAASLELLALVQSAKAGEAAAIVPVDPSTYTPGPLEPGWQVGWFARSEVHHAWKWLALKLLAVAIPRGGAVALLQLL